MVGREIRVIVGNRDMVMQGRMRLVVMGLVLVG